MTLVANFASKTGLHQILAPIVVQGSSATNDDDGSIAKSLGGCPCADAVVEGGGSRFYGDVGPILLGIEPPMV